MYQILLVIHVILTLAMIAIILVQRSSSDGLGGIGGGGGGGGFLTGRSQANLLTRTTAVLATLFILNSLALSWLTQKDTQHQSIADKITAQEEAMPQVPTPGDESATVPDANAEAEAPAEQPTIPQPAE